MGVLGGRWPISVDPGDVTRVYFQDPADHSWHTLLWEHAADLGRPLSAEALGYARWLAVRTHRFPDVTRAVMQLLERWGVGLTDTAAERRMALRLSHERLRLLGGTQPATPDRETGSEIAELPTVRRVTAALTADATDQGDDEHEAWPEAARLPTQRACPDPGGDDDEDGECDAAAPGDPAEVSDEDFYADVMDSA